MANGVNSPLSSKSVTPAKEHRVILRTEPNYPKGPVKEEQCRDGRRHPEKWIELIEPLTCERVSVGMNSQ